MKSQQCHEIVSFAFKPDVGIEKQNAHLALIGQFAVSQHGFISRSTFRESQTGRLIDHVIWTDQECATAAAQKIGQDQKLAQVMADMSESDVVFGHFTQIS
jgi:hypothetical protein